MKIILVSATSFEIASAIKYLEEHWTKVSFSEYSNGPRHVFPLVTGIGSMMMAFALARCKGIQNIDLVIHAGIAGSYKKELQPGDLVEVISEQFADLGAEDVDGSFLDVFELGLMNKNRFPYKDGKILKKKNNISTGLKQVDGLTVNKTSGTQASIDLITSKFQADVESMEGAGLFYACNVMDIPFVSIRAISNYVEPRDKSKWKIEEALDSLNNALIRLLGKQDVAN